MDAALSSSIFPFMHPSKKNFLSFSPLIRKPTDEIASAAVGGIFSLPFPPPFFPSSIARPENESLYIAGPKVNQRRIGRISCNYTTCYTKIYFFRNSKVILGRLATTVICIVFSLSLGLY